MAKIVVIFLISILVGTACERENVSSLKMKEEWPIRLSVTNAAIKEYLPLSRIAERIDYVPLQTCDSGLVGSIWQFQMADSFLVVQCGHELMTFKTDGRYIARFPSLDRGPGEELVRCFTIDSENKLIYLYGNYTHKVGVYTFDGKWKKTSVLFTQTIGSLFYWNNNLLGISYWDTVLDFFIQGFDLTSGDKIYEYKNPYTNKENTTRPTFTGQIAGESIVDIQCYKDSLLLFRNAFDDTLWQTNDLKTKKARYILDCGTEKMFSFEDHLNLFTREGDPVKKRETLKTNQINGVLETSGYLFFRYGSHEGGKLLGIYDKSKGELFFIKMISLNGKSFYNDLDGGPNFTPYCNILSQWIYEDKLYNLIWPYEFLGHKSEVPRSAAVEKLYRTVKENDNPILMIVTLKK